MPLLPDDSDWEIVKPLGVKESAKQEMLADARCVFCGVTGRVTAMAPRDPVDREVRLAICPACLENNPAALALFEQYPVLK